MNKKRKGSKSSRKAQTPRDTEFDVTFDEAKDDQYLDFWTLSKTARLIIHVYIYIYISQCILDTESKEEESKGIKRV